MGTNKFTHEDRKLLREELTNITFGKLISDFAMDERDNRLMFEIEGLMDMYHFRIFEKVNAKLTQVSTTNTLGLRLTLRKRN